MKKNYYGYCCSESGEANKIVVIQDREIVPETFNFVEGDLLTVFFAFKNTASNVTLKININDTNLNPSTSSDTGKSVNYIEGYSDLDGAWDNGETVLFAYTRQKNMTMDDEEVADVSNSNTYYWEIVEGGHAAKDTYGVTKLFEKTEMYEEDPSPTLSTWLTDGNRASEDSNIAITPNTVKRIFELMTTSREWMDDPNNPYYPHEYADGVGMQWIPSREGGESLGVFTLRGERENNEPDTGVSITYPIDARIRSVASGLITHTGQLENNGEGPNTEAGQPFITRYVTDAPSVLYFKNWSEEDTGRAGILLWEGEGTGYKYYIRFRNPNDYMVIGTDQSPYLQGVFIHNPTIINSTLSAKGITSNGNVNITGDLTTSGNIASGDDISATDRFYGSGIYIKHPTINDRYIACISKPSNNSSGGNLIGNGLYIKDNNISDENNIASIGHDGIFYGNGINLNHGKITVESGSGQINTTNLHCSDTLYGWNIKERGQLLSERYQKKIYRRLAPVELEIAKNESAKDSNNSEHLEYSFSDDIPIGVVGWDITYNGSHTSDSYWANIWECFINENNKLQFAVFNMNTSRAIKIKITFYVLVY